LTAARVYAKAQGLSRKCQNHAAIISLEAAEKGGLLLKQCEKAVGGRPEQTPARVAAVSEYRQTIQAAGLSERTAEVSRRRDNLSGRTSASRERGPAEGVCVGWECLMELRGGQSA